MPSLINSCLFLICLVNLLPLCHSDEPPKKRFKTLNPYHESVESVTVSLNDLPYESDESSSQALKINDLPSEMLEEILSRLPEKDHLSYKLTSKKFWSSFYENKDVLNEFLISNSHGAMSMEKVEEAMRKIIRRKEGSLPSSLDIPNLRLCLTERYLYPTSISFNKEELVPFFSKSPPSQEILNSELTPNPLESSGILIYMEVRRRKIPYLFGPRKVRKRLFSFLSFTPENPHPLLPAFYQSQIPYFTSVKGMLQSKNNVKKFVRSDEDALSKTDWWVLPISSTLWIDLHHFHPSLFQKKLHSFSLLSFLEIGNINCTSIFITLIGTWLWHSHLYLSPTSIH